MKRFNRIHAICEYLNRSKEKACQRCPASEPMPPYGKCQRFCYGIAKEVLDIAIHGNPWGKGTTRKNVARWRKNLGRARIERNKA